MPDLLFPIIMIPEMIQMLYIDSWLISGRLGPALCKICSFLSRISNTVSIQSLVLIAVDRFGAVVFPLRSPLIRSRLCPFFILAPLIVAIAVNSTDLFVFKLVEYPEGRYCENHWNKVFGESLSPENYFITYIVVFIFIPWVLIAILYIIIDLFKAQVTEDSRRAISQRWATTSAKGAKCVKDGHCYCVRVCSVLAAPRYLLVYSLLCAHDPMAELWHPLR